MGKKHFIDSKSLLLNSFKLAKMIWKDGYIPDYIISVLRGGIPVGIAVHEFFRFKGYNPNHISISCRTYTKFKQSGQIEMHGIDYAVNKVDSDDRLLIVDDVFDTGYTVQKVVNTINEKARKNPLDIKIATVYYKPNKNRTRLIPDYYIEKNNNWLVFPHELDGLNRDEIIKKGKKVYQILYEK